jgi:hypothetical protein
MMNKIVYKVLRRLKGGKLVSMYADNSAHCKVVEYRLNRLTKPHPTNNPFLFVFDDIEHAKRFAAAHSLSYERVVYAAVGINVREKAVDWEGDRLSITDYPIGTVFCDALLLADEKGHFANMSPTFIPSYQNAIDRVNKL